MLNYSESCERNKESILAVLAHYFADSQQALEIGSGSGQHALYFSEHLPHLCWQPTDRAAMLAALQQNLSAAKQNNLNRPQALDVFHPDWPILTADAVFTANSLHIMSAAGVEHFFAGLANFPMLDVLCIYGPFNYNGQFNSPSNARFDQWLKQRDPLSGIRDIEWICQLAAASRLKLVDDVVMPANNQTLVFKSL